MAACCVTVPLQLGLGYFIAREIGSAQSANRIQWVVAVIVGILAVLLGLNWWRQIRSHHRRPPRAKAAWLRRFRPARRRASVSD